MQLVLLADKTIHVDLVTTSRSLIATALLLDCNSSNTEWIIRSTISLIFARIIVMIDLGVGEALLDLVIGDLSTLRVHLKILLVLMP